MGVNLNLLFNKEYFDGYFEDNADKGRLAQQANKKLIGYYFTEEMPACSESILKQRFKVMYPGLVVGLGYVHETKLNTSGNDRQEEQNQLIKNGFSFDYVTGQPYIPGSSVKGILRSAFNKEKREFIIDQLKEQHSEITKNDITELEKKIFGGRPGALHAQHNKDIFFDAVITGGAEDIRLIKKGNLLDYEYITSHQADDPEYDGLTSPNPVRLLKIRPGVELEFRYLLTETILENGKKYGVEEKKELFKKIITFFGVGAKTNVGFGQLQDLSEY